MKRVLALLALVCAFLAFSACSYDIELAVDASADLNYANGDLIHIETVTFEGFHRRSLSDNDLEEIFIDLTQNVSGDFTTAILYLSLFDDISGEHLRDETYGVVYNSRTGRYDFADMDDVY